MTAACVLFEDSFVDRLWPINLARPSGWITCGGISLERMLTEQDIQVFWHARPHLRCLIKASKGRLAEPTDGPVLFVNAALVPDWTVIGRLKDLAQRGEPFIGLCGQRVTAAFCPAGLPEKIVDRGGAEVVGYLLSQRLTVLDDEFATLEHAADVVAWHESLLPRHLERLIASRSLRRLDHNVFVGQHTQLAANVVLDGTDGPVVIGDNVQIGPFSYLAGPVLVGSNSRIIDHASIKHSAVLGHTVKAGGEIEASIVEPYSNKQHHGFLGHAYVGSWVNLGAGTSNSDLKNTYGEITIDVPGQAISTGRQFFGCVIGDFTKTAINTSIFTGKLIGVASFVYGFVTTNVPSFTNYARSFGQVTEVPPDVAIKAQTRAAKRRNVPVTAVDQQLLRDLYELTRPERQLSNEQVVL
jgi:glucose-1-phosphate thymidylyltransferase